LHSSTGRRAFITGCEGLSLTEAEQRFFREARPCGFILFKRNCANPEQIRQLVASFHEAVGDTSSLVLIDQEGGRVQRLGPPQWRSYPPGRLFGNLYQRNQQKGLDAARMGARLIARDLAALGITVNCAPVLDVPVPGAHDIIGDRAYGVTPEQVAALGRAVMEGYLAGGVLPVVKHIPGHGRACADSHAALPVIHEACATLEETDFAPFRALADAPLGMTAHILLPELDRERPVSTSPVIIRDIIRGAIGFDGLLMCDDIGMRALNGPIKARAEAVLAAGCDVVLHCDGKLADMEAVATVTPELTGEADRRFQAAIGRLATPQAFDEAEAEALLTEVLAETA
jgi:beta-N-acetylhexosaminidase